MPHALRFKFEIIDDTTGDVIASDWTWFDHGRIDEYGNCETVDIHVGAAMRHVRRTQAAAKARAIVEDLA